MTPTISLETAMRKVLEGQMREYRLRNQRLNPRRGGSRFFPDEDNPSYFDTAAYVKRLLVHSARVEMYLNVLVVRVDDEQHPHDLVGPGNKLEWEVVRGLALPQRDTPERQKRYETAIELHRKGQRHHQMWNEPNTSATEADLKYGAIDSICSLREPRDYQGGIRSWDEIQGVIEKNPEHKKPWLRWAASEIRCLEEGL